MKRYLLTALLLISFLNAFAQDRHWQFGVKGGIGKSGIRGSKLVDNIAFDEYRRRTTYSVAGRVSYRFLKHFAVSVDPEFQVLNDTRKQTSPVYGVPEEIATFYTIDNRFKRIQLPLGIQFFPFKGKIQPYATIGILPYYITKGKVTETITYSIMPAILPDRVVTIREVDFNIGQNSKIRSAAPLFAGAGLGIGNHVMLEVTTTFSGRMNIQLDDPSPTFRAPMMGHNYALRNTRLSVMFMF